MDDQGNNQKSTNTHDRPQYVFRYVGSRYVLRWWGWLRWCYHYWWLFGYRFFHGGEDTHCPLAYSAVGFNRPDSPVVGLAILKVTRPLVSGSLHDLGVSAGEGCIVGELELVGGSVVSRVPLEEWLNRVDILGTGCRGNQA